MRVRVSRYFGQGSPPPGVVSRNRPRADGGVEAIEGNAWLQKAEVPTDLG